MYNIELYEDKNTVVHRFHPAVKIISLLVIFLSLILNDSLMGGLLYLTGILLIVLVARCWRILLKVRVLIILLFLVTVLMWMLIIRDGEPVLKMANLAVTDKGILTGISAGLRITAMLISGLLLIATTRIEELAYGLQKLGLSRSFTFSLTMAVRLVPLFLSTISQIIDAQTSRGHEIDTGGVFKKLKNYVPLLVPAFLSAIRNINQLSMALEARGFLREGKRSFYLHYKIGAKEYLVFFSLLGILILTLI